MVVMRTHYTNNRTSRVVLRAQVVFVIRGRAAGEYEREFFYGFGLTGAEVDDWFVSSFDVRKYELFFTIVVWSCKRQTYER
jgi:hypothetical protein